MDAKLRKEFTEIAERCGCELLDVSFKGAVLKLVIDKTDGVTISECEQVSREVSTFLDVAEFSSSQFTLEVTSPGLDREFYRDEDYERFQGREVKMTWKSDDMTRKTTAEGTLAAFDRDAEGGPSVHLQVGDQQLEIPLHDILKTRLVPDFS